MSFVFKKLYQGETVAEYNGFKFKELTSSIVINDPSQQFYLDLLIIPKGTYYLSATSNAEGFIESNYSNEEIYIRN